MNSAMIRMDLLTEITVCPVCRETRSAVRCLVPASSVGMPGSGTNWTAARTIALTAPSSTMAPSILASSRSRVAENPAFSSNPPEHKSATA